MDAAGALMPGAPRFLRLSSLRRSLQPHLPMSLLPAHPRRPRLLDLTPAILSLQPLPMPHGLMSLRQAPLENLKTATGPALGVAT